MGLKLAFRSVPKTFKKIRRILKDGHKQIRYVRTEGKRFESNTRVEPLLLETKTLNLVEVLPHFKGYHVVRGDAVNGAAGAVGGRVEGQRSLPGRHDHLSLLRFEVPRQARGRVRVERYPDLPVCPLLHGGQVRRVVPLEHRSAVAVSLA